ncbi:MAG: GerAB/ArcD/ProY family transporter [bacterium]|jgi:spore germination protein KB
MLDNGRISGRQAFKLLVITILATEILLLAGITAQEAGNDAWLVPGAALIGSIVIVLVQARLAANFPEQTVAQYSQLILGSVLGRLAGLIYSLFFFHLATLVLRQFAVFMVTSFMRLHHWQHFCW